MSFTLRFLFNQRVIVGNEIGTVMDPRGKDPNGNDIEEDPQALLQGVWVYLPSSGLVTCCDEIAVSSLPGGQL